MPETLIQIIAGFFITLIAIRVSAPLAHKINLLDIPDHRKQHSCATPLTGGIAIYSALLIVLCATRPFDGYLISFLAASGLLVLFGALDDRNHLRVRHRVILEIIAASVMIFGADLWVGNLGNLLGVGSIHMPFWAGYLFTLVAVFGVINAINMLDGLDGLAGGVTLAIFIVLVAFTEESKGLLVFGFAMAGALLVFLISNTAVTRWVPKVFLGDAGSKLLGLSIVWVLIETARTQNGTATSIQPATALYLIAIPLMDMVDTTISRARRGHSPFKADRTHLHHVLLNIGFSRSAVVVIVVFASLAFNLLGIAMTKMHVPEIFQFGFFFLSFIGLMRFKKHYQVGNL
ncbi:MAG: hypothetical protein AB7U63_02120 [Porticoccaceae bacterium]